MIFTKEDLLAASQGIYEESDGQQIVDGYHYCSTHDRIEDDTDACQDALALGEIPDNSHIKKQMQTLAVSIADKWARTVIQCACSTRTISNDIMVPATAETPDNELWWDLNTAESDGIEKVRESVRYLQLRGSLLRHPEAHYLVRFKTEV